ncbi:MAG: MFS transporter [candidate division NC10 bacterium]|nr:MFS transporter [candidate division NC10 bacterium]MBI2115473.1 MFS transporter [candidate division NC10 bacterium]MBI2457289.1 MFS transporter [candidate division NC10 bacterium]
MPRLSAAWRSLLIAGLTMTVQNGALLTFPVVYVALLEEFRWGRGEAAGIYSVATLMIGLGGPLTGFLLDRFGPRRLFVGGALVTAGGMAATTMARSLSHFYLTYGILTGIGNSALTSTPNMVVVSKWFPRGTGRAIAIADIGTGLGVILIVPAAQWLILRLGWRMALFTLAAFLLLVLVPANWEQRLPEVGEADGPNSVGGPPLGPTGRDWTLRSAVASPRFWWLVLARFCSGLAFQMMNVHLVAYVVGAGYGKMTAASTMGAVSMVSMLGRYLVGLASDRLGRAMALTLAYTSTTLGILALMSLATLGPVALFAFALCYGLSQGSSGIVVAARAADLFQGGSFGRIYGWMSVTNGIGEGLGAWLGGAVYDRTGSYQAAFGSAILALAIGAASIWLTYAKAAPVEVSRRA